ncbi:NAD(P)-binding protein [Aspergillus sclerotioniger CBS 115572]|uniref:NAD(P)-binding protein n=1 Tax=Aspergillus sclerotioniger CBS 115572 TaxID=1450535 RepID=A0A317VAB7_9EURO|nr:NAD(P)-binding protein [Aspergillus sclerotioniger CBS 115572]PWY70299.1 NAD(P)-binding protein [Aspergillus sclerotioniger CBS 115572]
MQIALFGPTGQVGQSILHALLSTTPYQILQITSPRSNTSALSTAQTLPLEQQSRLNTKSIDLVTCTTDALIPLLTDIEIIISALNGPALHSQSKIQDAGAITGVRRFYPSEYGMHHVYQPAEQGDGKGCGWGYIHPTWMEKITATEKCLHHPAITSGSMTYTIIGSGDLYNQAKEETWCPWTNPTLPSYTIYIIGDPSAKINFTHTDDLAAFLIQTIQHPEVSENKELNFVSDTVSYNDIAALLEKYSGREVQKVVYPGSLVDEVLRDRGMVPREVKAEGGAFGDDFWVLVRGVQGLGRFVRPRGMVHNGLFPVVEGVRTVEGYFGGLFGK